MTVSSFSQRAAIWRASSKRLVGLSLLLVGAVAAAQAVPRIVTSATPEATRAELTHRLDSLVRVEKSGGKPKVQKARRDEIAALRTRLAEGDFPAGERFIIDYGASSQRPDTVVVRDSSNFSLSNWPSASLHGVLRSELQDAVEKYVGTYVREPRIRVYPLTRLQVTGGVGRPGFYNVQPTQPLSDAIMLAGGTGQTGKPDKITIYRGKDRILDKTQVANALRDGATIADLGLESGDQIRVDQVKIRNFSSGNAVRSVVFGVSVALALLAFIRATYQP